jgi:hypothetical protein
MDLTGIMTPAVQSGMNTPFYSHSRGGSIENLAGLHNYSPNGANGANGAPSPDALTNRLQNLHMSSRNPMSRNNSFRHLPENHSGGNTPHQQSGGQSVVQSRRTSEEEGDRVLSSPPTPEHIDYADLAKVPSYQTAVQAPPPRGISFDPTLPNYETAISAPPSPAREFVQLARNGAINGHNGVSITPNGPSGDSLASIGFTAVQAPVSGHR